MGTRRRALSVAAVLAAVTLMAGCGQGDGPGPLDSRTTPASASPETTVEASDLVVPSDVGIPELSAVLAPSSADASGGIPVSDDGVGVAGDGDVVVDVYFDFMCSYCGLLDQINGADLDELVAGGGVTVVYHPVSILDRLSEGAAYSTRAANAVAVVADLEPQHVPAFITALLSEDVQPPGSTTGLSDLEIAQIAQVVGVSPDVTDEFTTTADYEGSQLRSFVPWTVAATATLPVPPGGASAGTPSVLIDDEWFGSEEQNWMHPGVLRAAVEAAKG